MFLSFLHPDDGSFSDATYRKTNIPSFSGVNQLGFEDRFLLDRMDPALG